MYFDSTQKQILRRTFLLGLIFVNLYFINNLLSKGIYDGHLPITSINLNLYIFPHYLAIVIFWFSLCIWEKTKEKGIVLFGVGIIKILVIFFLKTTWIFYILFLMEFLVVFLYFTYKQIKWRQVRIQNIILYILLTIIVNFVFENFNSLLYWLISEIVIRYFINDFNHYQAYKYLVFDIQSVTTFLTPYLVMIFIFMLKNFQQNSQYFKNILHRYFQVSKREFAFLFILFYSLFIVQLYNIFKLIEIIHNWQIGEHYHYIFSILAFILIFLLLQNLLINRILSIQNRVNIGIEYYLAFIPILNIFSFLYLTFKETKILKNLIVKPQSYIIIYIFIIVLNIAGLILSLIQVIYRSESSFFIIFLYQLAITITWLVFIQQKNTKYVLLLLYIFLIVEYLSSEINFLLPEVYINYLLFAPFYDSSYVHIHDYSGRLLSIFWLLKLVLPFIFERVLFFEIKKAK